MVYHIEYTKPDNVMMVIKHLNLKKEVQNFISEKNVQQEEYFCKQNRYFLFLYINNGDRIDCPL